MLGRCDRSAIALMILGTALTCQAQLPNELTDGEVLKIIHGGPRVPAGFYTEPPARDDKVTISSSWVRRQAERSSPYFPVHAMYADEARRLTQEFLHRPDLPGDARQIVRQKTTPRFFQFDTEYKIGDRTHLTRLRVWRADFYEPKPVTFDSFAWIAPVGKPQQAAVGILRARPLDKDKARQLAEFFWWKENQNMLGVTVLREPTVKEQGDLLIVSFPTAVKVGGDICVQDVIHVFNSELVLNGKTGEVTRRVEKVKEIAGNK